MSACIVQTPRCSGAKETTSGRGREDARRHLFMLFMPIPNPSSAPEVLSSGIVETRFSREYADSFLELHQTYGMGHACPVSKSQSLRPDVHRLQPWSDVPLLLDSITDCGIVPLSSTYSLSWAEIKGCPPQSQPSKNSPCPLLARCLPLPPFQFLLLLLPSSRPLTLNACFAHTPWFHISSCELKRVS